MARANRNVTTTWNIDLGSSLTVISDLKVPKAQTNKRAAGSDCPCVSLDYISLSLNGFEGICWALRHILIKINRIEIMFEGDDYLG